MNNDYSKFEQYVKGILNSEIISKVIGNRLEVKEERMMPGKAIEPDIL